MKSYPFVLSLALIVASALAEPTRQAPSAAPDAGAAPRRSELREALRGARMAEPRQAPASAAASEKRQLSVQERADLRHQLRQQGRSERP